MAKSPKYHELDLVGLALRDRDLPRGIGVPDFETAVILAHICSQPGLMKRDIVHKVLERLKRPITDEAIVFKYIDCLVSIGQIAKHDFCFYLTPNGTKRLRLLRENLRSAMDLIYMVTP